jgi:hypothetical protein
VAGGGGVVSTTPVFATAAGISLWTAEVTELSATGVAGDSTGIGAGAAAAERRKGIGESVIDDGTGSAGGIHGLVAEYSSKTACEWESFWRSSSSLRR